MNMRLFKKELKSRGLSFRSLLAFFEEVKKGQYIRKDYHVTHQVQGRPSSNAFIYKSELDFISRCILDYKNIETGGQLFGYWTADGSPVVVYAIGPGTNANHQVAFFNQDVDYLVNVGNVLVHHYGLQHIGEWHSHHKLGLAQPSGHDASTVADTIREKSLPLFLLCIGNCSDVDSTLNPFNFTLGAGYNYVKAQWTVRDIDSPYRNLIDRELKDFLIQPATRMPSYKMDRINKSVSAIEVSNEGYWFENKQNRLVLKKIMDFVASYPQQAHCAIQMDSQNHIQLLVKRHNQEECIYFPSKFPQTAPEIQFTLNGTYVPVHYRWEYNGDIFNAFVECYKSIYNYDGR